MSENSKRRSVVENWKRLPPKTYPVSGFPITVDGEEVEFSAELFREVLPFKLGGLMGEVSGFLAGPSVQNLKTMDEVRREVPAAIDETNALVGRFGAFAKQLFDAGIYPVGPKPVK